MNGALFPGEHSNDPGLATDGPGTGTTAYYEARVSPRFLADNWTMVCWFNRRTTGGFQGLFRYGVGSNNNLIDTYTLNASNVVRTDVYTSGGAASQTIDTSTSFTTNKRQMFAISLRGGNYRTYLNGLNTGTTASTTSRTTATNTLRIGGGANANIDGISAALVWNERGLTDDEMFRLYVEDLKVLLLPSRRSVLSTPPAASVWRTTTVKVWT